MAYLLFVHLSTVVTFSEWYDMLIHATYKQEEFEELCTPTQAVTAKQRAQASR